LVGVQRVPDKTKARLKMRRKDGLAQTMRSVATLRMTLPRGQGQRFDHVLSGSSLEHTRPEDTAPLLAIVLLALDSAH